MIMDVNSSPKLESTCKKCFWKTYERLFQKFNASDEIQIAFKSFYDLLMEKGNHLSTPEVQRELSAYFSKLSGVEDLFLEEKNKYNKLAAEIVKEWKPKLSKSDNPFQLALRLSIAGNIIDFGADHNFDVNKTIEKVINNKFALDHSDELTKSVKNAKSILYLGDNAGEIVFDRLFIETVAHQNVIFAVKGGPILNDVLMEDALETQMDDFAKIISNGYDAPSTVLDKSSEEFQKQFKNADLIISKGQGNLEGLIHLDDPRIFYLLMVKCDVIAKTIGVEKGDFVVFNKTYKEK